MTVSWLSRLLVLAVSSVLSLAFPEPAWWWLGWVGLAPVFWLIARSPTLGEAMLRAWLAGVGFLTALHYWVIPHTVIFTPLLAGFLGLFWLPIGAAVWWTMGREAGSTARRAAVVVVPAVWMVIEAMRSWEYLGGTWGLWGLSQWQIPLVVQSAALGGVWLLSFLLVAVNVSLATAALPGRSRGQRSYAVGVALAIPVAVVVFGAVRADPPITGTVTIGAVQAGVYEDPAERLDAHIEVTRTLEGSSYDFVVWGQTSVGFDPSREPEVEERLRATAASSGTDLFVNVDARTPDGIVKTTVQYRSDGPLAEYGKRRLVPFGEYIPLRPVFGWVADFTEAAPEDRQRGQKAVVMVTSGVDIGPLISYESTFPDMRRELARLNVDMTLVQGATSTFQGTWAQPQQASYEAVNAVASGRPAVLIAMSGTSAAFDARGERLAWVPADRTGAFMIDVPLSQEDTLYVRFGEWVLWISLLIVAIAMAAALVRRSRTGGRDEELP